VLGTWLAISTLQAVAIPMSALNIPVFDQDQTEMINLSDRADAKRFSGINQLLNKGDYEAVIAKANTVLEKSPNSGLAYEILGAAYFLSGQQQQSIEPLKKAIKLEPGESGALTKLGIIYMESDNLAEAEKLLLQAVQVNPKHRFAHQRLGLLYEYQNKDQLAIKHFRQGLEETSKSYIGVAVNLGRLLNKSGNYHAAVAVLEPRVSLREPLADAQLVLATAYLATGEYTKARLRYQQVLKLGQAVTGALLGLAKAQRGEGNLPAAHATINKLVILQPKSSQAKLEEAEILLRQGRQKESSAAFDRAVTLGASRNYINQRIAKYHLDREEYIQAQDIYLSMIKDRTADAFVYGQLSELLMRQGDIEKGEQILNQGVKQYPDSGYLRLRHGSYLASIGKYEESLPELKKATELVPDDVIIWKTYAFALSRADHKGDAVNAAAKLYELQPNVVESAIFYASKLSATGQLDGAEVIYRKIIKKAPKHALALNNLANILASRNKYSEAEKMARRAVSIVNDNGNIQDTLGWILYKQGRLNEALDVFSHANKIAPEVAVIWYHYGLALANADRKSEARAAFEKALSFNPSAEWVTDAKQRLQ